MWHFLFFMVSMGTLYLYLPIILVSYMLTKFLVNKIKNLPPSPFPTLPIIGHFYLLKPPLQITLSKIAARFGPILLLQMGCRRVVLVSSPSAVEECLSKNDVIFANRPRLLMGKHLGYNYTAVAWASYGDHLRNLRRMASTQILSPQRVLALQGIRVEEVRLLIRRLARGPGQATDMAAVLFELTSVVLMRMIVGKRYSVENVAETEEGRMFREIIAEQSTFGNGTYIGDFFPAFKWFGVGGLEKEMIVAQRKRDCFMQGLIEEHKRKMETCGGSKDKSMIEVLLSLQETDPEHYSDEIVKGFMLDLLVGGTDSSAGTVESSLYFLINNPEVLKKAQAEIDNCVGQNRLLEESDLPALPYLHCILNETLRMRPPGPLMIPHESSEDCTVGGYHIPRGTMLVVNLWAIQNDPNLWEDHAKFKPERFEGLEGWRDGFKLMPFGFGRRGCPGEGLGTRMSGLALGSLIQCFDWVGLAQGDPLKDSEAQPLIAKCHPRDAMANLLSQI